jgi:predicted secreted Zn-dependent protease
MRTILLAALAFAWSALPAGAASLAKTYSYFTIEGSTLDQLEQELSSRGPQVKSTGRRHPGATQMQFTTKLTYEETRGYCRVGSATVTVSAKVILPRWKPRGGAGADLRHIWETLSRDIKRHEESHVVIAKNHAAEIERALRDLPRSRSCETLAARASAVTNGILQRHDRKQADFDRVEGINFERRILQLLRYRLEQMEAGRLPG